MFPVTKFKLTFLNPYTQLNKTQEHLDENRNISEVTVNCMQTQMAEKQVYETR